ncbi:MAG: ATP-binding protein [Chitinophagaceae bacterium]|nr:ATP-binding protein [Chitinophagaceae bacterium]MCW5904416.1 ATP-binding protein [Chitinophagaceae bacterium]
MNNTIQPIKKIVIIGAESTGKSTLSELLAQHYTTEWCPEFAREYLLTNGTNYTFDDLEIIAKGQLALENEYERKVTASWKKSSDNNYVNSQSLSVIQHPPLLFIDTNMYVMKVWCEYVFNKCHQFILDEIVNRKYDLYLLCNIDLPWVKDELREYPDEKPRQELHKIYKDIMINQTTAWTEISGGYDERLKKAINAINNLIGNNQQEQ